ncbi:ester cyclase [Streptomyces sp. CA-106131]|uniref:ester cyclase n=1 Tax=Streptomyces sp. CA-106131 TaxID=3240045 RepID=UPI003D8F1F74
MPTAADTVREWKRRMRAREFDRMADVVDLEGYTEICLGLTGWTTGYDVALQNYIRNMVEPWSDQVTTEVESVEGEDAVVTRSHLEATHTGEFLGISATGRRVEWDAITIVKVREGRVVGQWAQPDLWGIYQQLIRPE